jgi:hypothetical protein
MVHFKEQLLTILLEIEAFYFKSVHLILSSLLMLESEIFFELIPFKSVKWLKFFLLIDLCLSNCSLTFTDFI